MVQAKTQHSIEDIIMLGNRGKHLPHRLSHRLPLLLMSDIFLIDKRRHIMGNDRSRVQLPHDLGRIPWLYCSKEHHTAILRYRKNFSSSAGFFMILSFRGGASGIARTEKKGAKTQVEGAFFRKKKHCNSFMEVSLWPVAVKQH